MLGGRECGRGRLASRLLVLGGAVSALLVLAGASLGGQSATTAAQSPVPRFSWSGPEEDRFGESVAVSRTGTTVVIGVAGRRGGPYASSARPGAAWVLTRRLPSERWDKVTLTGSTDAAAGFGTSVAISADGKVVLVGAPFDNRRRKGTAWIFLRTPGGGWVRQKLTGQGEAGQSGFGWSVALSENGSTAVVGGRFDNGGRGAAWIFVRSGSSWRQQGPKLTKGGELGADAFGHSVAVSADGNLVLIGGPRDGGGVGAVWIFSRSGSRWRQQGNKLTPPGRPVGWSFGWDVALGANGTIALVGAPRPDAGATFVYTRSGSDWRRRPRLDGGKGFGYGVSLSPDGRTAAVTGYGAYQQDRAWHDVTGYVFSCSSLGCLGAGHWLGARRDRDDNHLRAPAKDVAVANDADTVVTSARRLRRTTRDPHPGRQVRAFLNWPLVRAISPQAGPTGGGTEVTISGQNFTKVRGVLFGSTRASQFTVESPTRITATSPPGTQSVHVRVQTSVGLSPNLLGGWGLPAGQFSYVARPTVTAVTPASGPTEGGTEVTITGTGFEQFRSNVVRFGTRTALSVRFVAPTELKAVSPSANAGPVDVTVTTVGGTSAPSAASRFTYVAPPALETVIGFDNLTTGGPGEPNAQTVVNSQYAAQGVTFNDVRAIDYSKGAGAIAGFARSGSAGIEQCVGVEFCSSPIRATFSTPMRMVRVWVGFSYRLNDPIQVQLTAYTGSAVAGTATVPLAANSSPTPINAKLEVRLATASITSFDVSVPGGYTAGLAVDDVTFEKP